QEYDLSKHLPLARKIAEQAIGEMLHYVGDASDIKNIMLVGGGSFFFKKAIKEAFPKHRIHELKDALYANVKGFQLAGLEYAKTLIASEASQAKVGTGSVGASSWVLLPAKSTRCECASSSNATTTRRSSK